MSNGTSIKRAVEILNLYTVGNTELGPTEIAQKLGINKSTVMRLVATLTSANLLARSDGNKKYRLNGKIIMRLSRAFLLSNDIATVSLPYMEELRGITRETICIYARDKDKRICLATLESPQAARRGATPGYLGPLQAGAPGKVLLASLSDDKVSDFIKKFGLPKYTESTITDEQELKNEIKKIRQDGVAVSKGEVFEYIYSIAAPVRNYTGNTVAALSIEGVIMRLSPDIEKEFSMLVKESATALSHELGYIK